MNCAAEVYVGGQEAAGDGFNLKRQVLKLEGQHDRMKDGVDHGKADGGGGDIVHPLGHPHSYHVSGDSLLPGFVGKLQHCVCLQTGKCESPAFVRVPREEVQEGDKTKQPLFIQAHSFERDQ